MVYIDHPYNVTLTAPIACSPALLSAARSAPGHSFEQAANINRIYQHNGLICQRNMCQSMFGCEDPITCSRQQGWDKINEFCGPIETRGVYMNGGWWRLEPANTRQVLTTATEQATGLSVLPTPYNVSGMY